LLVKPRWLHWIFAYYRDGVWTFLMVYKSLINIDPIPLEEGNSIPISNHTKKKRKKKVVLLEGGSSSSIISSSPTAQQPPSGQPGETPHNPLNLFKYQQIAHPPSQTLSPLTPKIHLALNSISVPPPRQTIPPPKVPHQLPQHHVLVHRRGPALAVAHTCRMRRTVL
jgi:hypothetical protein